MGNRPQPEEHIAIQLHAIRRAAWEKAWNGETLHASDRADISRIDNLIDFVAERNARKSLAAAIDKGVETLDYLNKLAKPCGLGIVDLDAEREKRRVANIADYT